MASFHLRLNRRSDEHGWRRAVFFKQNFCICALNDSYVNDIIDITDSHILAQEPGARV